MSATAAVGLVFLVVIAAAFAGFWHRVWRVGTLPSALAAACTAACAVALDYVTTRQLTAYIVPIFAILFAVAWTVAGVVQIATRRARAKESAVDA
jgi:hypothetical protein